MSTGDLLQPLRRDSTPERIASRLRSGIVTGRFPPGQALREVEIARQLGVSRGPVREAFQRLIQEGLLEAHPARGVFVPQLTADDIADLYLARGAVETTAAQLLVKAEAAEPFGELSAALGELEAAPVADWNELADLDLHLHAVLVRSTGSMRLARMFDTLAAETRLCMVALESFYPERADLVTEHAEIVQAIQRRDAGAATRLLERHMSDSVRRLSAPERQATRRGAGRDLQSPPGGCDARSTTLSTWRSRSTPATTQSPTGASKPVDRPESDLPTKPLLRQGTHVTSQRDAGLADRIRRIWLDAAHSGAAFPGEPALARELQASRPAVREALVRLEAEGLINKRQGAETAVNRAAVEIAARLDQQVDNEEIIEAMGRKASMDILEADVIALNEDDSTALELTKGSKALRVAKRWRADGVPVLVAINLIPLLQGEKPADADVGQSLFRLVRRLGHQRVEWELAWPSATNLEPPVSDWLEQPPGRAALTLEMVGVSRAGHRAYLATEFHVPTAFRYGLIRSVR